MNESAEKQAFLKRFAEIYESSAWVAEALWDKRSTVNLSRCEDVARAMADIVDRAGDAAQLKLIRAHPELAGKAARAGQLTSASASEQAGAGLDSCSETEVEAFRDLNEAYRTKFGFPFIVAVAGLTRHQILAQFSDRLSNDPAEEQATALQQIHRIARFRLESLGGWREEPAMRSPVNVALERLGAEVVVASDEFFAPRHRLILPSDPVFIPDKYDDHGKWMDGWESRRRREPGHDYCVLRLGAPCRVDSVVIDTRHFTGNFPPEAAIEATLCEERIPPGSARWHPVVSRVSLSGDQVAEFKAEATGPWTHLRLNIFPDGGVARLRVYGSFAAEHRAGGPAFDAAAIVNGGKALLCNNEHFGKVSNMLMPGRGVNMGDGWETRRRRTPGHDWAIIELGAAVRVEQITVDTAFFKGNYPARCSIQAAGEQVTAPEGLADSSRQWPELLSAQALGPDAQFQFSGELLPHDPVRLLRLNIYPDGGISRLRVMGRVE